MESGARPEVLHPTLEHTVMVGYQGWFRTPSDGAHMGWAHYEQAGTKDFSPGHAGIDFWPDVTDLPASARVATSFANADGTPATVFSSHDAGVVDVHFRWMQDYGIDGAFVQRFAEPIVFDNEASRTRLRATDDVLRFATAAAARHGRSVAVMYDLSGLPANAIGRVLQDWRHVVDDLKVRQSPAYQYHRGRPVVAVWGVGFDDGRAYTLDEVSALIAFLKDDPVYGGNTVMLGIPTWWREQTADAIADSRLHAVLQKADILSPWAPGRYDDMGGVEAHAERFWAPDRAWCTAHGLDYLPVVFPGFSWRNLKGAHGGISRDDGRFLWAQYRALANRGFTMVYQAMFDEMDEGTQIFKTSAKPPPGTFFASYDPLPPDHYLWLVGAAAGYLRTGRRMPESIDDRPNFGAANRYLRRGDRVAYDAVPELAEAHRRFFQIGDALTAGATGRVPLAGSDAHVSVTGDWFPRHLWSTDASASVTWELDVPAAGSVSLKVRYPGDPNLDHATAARLRIIQRGLVLDERRINLRENSLRWNEIAKLQLQAGSPCQVILDQGGASGSLVLFEPQLLPAK